MKRSKAARQVSGWMDYYSLDVDSFATLVEGVGGVSREAVLSTVLDGRRPVVLVARAIEKVTGVDADDWFVDERSPLHARRGRPSGEYAATPGPASVSAYDSHDDRESVEPPPPSGERLCAVA